MRLPERYAMHSNQGYSQMLKVKSVFCITENTTDANLIRLYEKVNNNEMVCHSQN